VFWEENDIHYVITYTALVSSLLQMMLCDFYFIWKWELWISPLITAAVHLRENWHFVDMDELLATIEAVTRRPVDTQIARNLKGIFHQSVSNNHYFSMSIIAATQLLQLLLVCMIFVMCICIAVVLYGVLLNLCVKSQQIYCTACWTKNTLAFFMFCCIRGFGTAVHPVYAENLQHLSTE